MVPPLGRSQLKQLKPPPDRPGHLPGHKPGRKARAYPYQRDTVVIHKHHYLQQPTAVADEAAIPPPESSGATVVETWEFSAENGAQMIDKEVHP
jgi:hypothetical protein